ncbi:MAG: hypothetical protein ABW007_19160 [Chitinophagaceae bacterium]
MLIKALLRIRIFFLEGKVYRLHLQTFSAPAGSLKQYLLGQRYADARKRMNRLKIQLATKELYERTKDI